MTVLLEMVVRCSTSAFEHRKYGNTEMIGKLAFQLVSSEMIGKLAFQLVSSINTCLLRDGLGGKKR